MFGARTYNIFRPQLGNDDAADLVRDSVTNYSSGGRVGAEGHMNCEVGPG